MERFIIYYVNRKDLKLRKPVEEGFHVIEAKNIDEAIEIFYSKYPKKEYEVTGYDEVIGGIR